MNTLCKLLRSMTVKKFVNITKENLRTLPSEEKEEETNLSVDKLCLHIKDILGDKVEKVVPSQRIVNSPCCIVTSEYGWSAYMEKIMKAQALRNDSMGLYMSAKKILEVNPTHPIIMKLLEKFNNDSSDKTINNLVWLMYESSLLTSGFNLDDPSSFVDRINRMIGYGLSIENDTNTNGDQSECSVNRVDTDNNMDEEDNGDMEKVD